MTSYAELAAASNFSFLRGASHPEELIGQAAHLGLAGFGLCDRNSVAGVVRAHLAKREQGLAPRYHPGARLVFCDGTPDILAYPQDRAGWGQLCRLLTVGNLRAEKGDCLLHLDDLLVHAAGLQLIVTRQTTRDPNSSSLRPKRSGGTASIIPAQNAVTPGERDPGLRLRRPRNDNEKNGLLPILHRLREAAPRRVRLAASMLYLGDDRARLERSTALAREAQAPLIAVNDVLYHHPDRRELQDVLTCIREHTTIEAAGRRLAVNAERHLKPPAEMARLFRDAPEAITETLRLSDALAFSLDELKFEYPDETRAGFATPQDALRHYTYEGAAQRYPQGIPEKVRATLEHELAFIASLQYAPYFLTVHDIVRFARSQGILCQGRGSAANSSVCFCLGVTEVDPNVHDLLFERFISADRREPPDIDVDFEHERREEVIQYIYGRYGREHTGIAGTVICYRGRSAIREVGKVFGLSEDTIGVLSSSIWGGGGGEVRTASLERAGIDVEAPRIRKMRALVDEIQSFPRHLSQHVGGFVMTRSRLDEVVPIGNAAMEKRTFVEWDKDDLDALGILKVDVLGLGMLTCIRKALEMLERDYGVSFRMPPVARATPSRTSSSAKADFESPPPLRGRSIDAGLPALIGRGVTDDAAQVSTPLPNPPPSEVGPARLRNQTQPTSGTPDVGGGREKLAAKADDPVSIRASDGSGTPAFTGLPACAGNENPSLSSPPPFSLALIPAEDPAVYRMLQRADSIGVFQVESRAQMTMLPRLKPEKFYDLVIEVAIVRPGPIQGDMVHPYLRRRRGLEQAEYPSPKFGAKDELRQVLEKTLGVPLFQEQAMRIAIVAGGFSPSEADQLRRAMATFKRVGTIGTFRDKMIAGMVRKGYEREFAERCFRQIEGFGEYGFPESHAASFALLVYASAWLKCHYPDVFAAALLNAQPMGFYAPAQIVRDVREHGVEVRPVDINHSDYDATLEDGAPAAARLHDLHRMMAADVRSARALRLGLRAVKGLSEDHAKLIVARRNTSSSQMKELKQTSSSAKAVFKSPPPLRGRSIDAGLPAAIGRGVTDDTAQASTPLPTPPPQGGREEKQTSSSACAGNDGEQKWDKPYDSIRDLWLRTGLSPRVLERLADADAFGSLGLPRRDALWAVKALGRAGDNDDLPLFRATRHPEMRGDEIAEPRRATVSSSFEARLRRAPQDDGFDGERENLSPPPLRGRSIDAGLPAASGRGVTDDAAQVAIPLPTQGARETYGEPDVALPPMPLGEEVINDYRFLHLSLRAHPASFLRADLAPRGIVTNETLRQIPSGRRVKVSGLITCRQRPGSANGVIFITIEDETALANIIVWPKTFETFRPIVLGARYIAVEGKLQEECGVIHIVADRLDDLTNLLARLTEEKGLQDEALARCDEVRRPVNELREQRLGDGRKSPLHALLAEMPALAADLDVPARGSAHSPSRRAMPRTK